MLYSSAELKEAELWLNQALGENIKTEISHMTVGEWATEKRVLPQGLSALPGAFRWDVTPYLQEIADTFSAQSEVQECYVMKGAQIGFTVGVQENLIGYVIDCEPGPMDFVTGDKEMAGASMELRIDRMIQSAGIAHKIFSQTEKKSNKRSGDTKDRKEFPGGFLMAIGPNSASKLRTFSIRYLLLDEMDAYPRDTEGEGDPIKLLYRRTDSFEAIRKIMGGSTPTTAQDSRIKEYFDQGDQRRYFVPCKKCGEMQHLEWKNLKWETDEEGHLIYDSVHYECCKCGAHWKNTDKAWFLPRGKWRPTKKPARPNLRSYHITSMLSPVGMRSWESAVDEWLDAQGDAQKIRVFVNTFLGEPYIERGDAPQWERIMLRREQWQSEQRGWDKKTGQLTLSEVEKPEGAVLLTIGADVQKDRIECECVAWGKNKESWSVGYHVFFGDPSKVDDPIWDDFQAYIQREHGGLVPALTLINSSYLAPQVYTFCDRFGGRGVLAVQGSNHYMQGISKMATVKGHITYLVTLNVDNLKLEVYGYLQTPPATDKNLPTPPGYCHFPANYDDHYFKMLTAEERSARKDRKGYTHYEWHKIRERNEALDCRVYAMGALYTLASTVSGAVDGNGLINWSYFWEELFN